MSFGEENIYNIYTIYMLLNIYKFCEGEEISFPKAKKALEKATADDQGQS